MYVNSLDSYQAIPATASSPEITAASLTPLGFSQQGWATRWSGGHSSSWRASLESIAARCRALPTSFLHSTSAADPVQCAHGRNFLLWALFSLYACITLPAFQIHVGAVAAISEPCTRYNKRLGKSEFFNGSGISRAVHSSVSQCWSISISVRQREHVHERVNWESGQDTALIFHTKHIICLYLSFENVFARWMKFKNSIIWKFLLCLTFVCRYCSILLNKHSC